MADTVNDLKRADRVAVAEDSTNKFPEATLSEFFEVKPANVIFSITEKLNQAELTRTDSCSVKLPSIRLWCNTAECQNICVYQPNKASIKVRHYIQKNVVEFACCSCHESKKKYAFSYQYNPDSRRLIALKLGEHPPPSHHLPSRLRTLVGVDQEKLDKGLRSEARGLGIGAFAYYRQIVENQKDRIIDEIVKVASLRNPIPKSLIHELTEARLETQFSSAVEKIKHAIPEALQIKGHNPLTLLHKALSEGLHAGTDAECLEIARDIRVILSEFSERLSDALKDKKELDEAVSRVIHRSAKGKKTTE
jgi:hypothetical protein